MSTLLSARQFLLFATTLFSVPISLNGAEPAKPLQVFILAGQSNMQGHAKVSTFEDIGMDPATKPMLAEMLGAHGKPKVCQRVWISSIVCADAEQTGKLTAGFGATEEKIGPEFTFGIYMEKFTDAPILLIKTSWGGKSLNTDFRPPSAGPYGFNETQLAAFQEQVKDVAAVQAEKAAATGVSYRLMVGHVKMVLADIKRVVPGYDAYGTAMAHFIRDVRKDLNAPELPFVIGLLGVGGPVADYGAEAQRYKATHQNFRDAMAAPAQLPEFKGNVAAVLAEKYLDRGLTAEKAKENEIKQRAKKLAEEGHLKAAEEQAALEKLRAEWLTERERQMLEKGISNLEFHYLGSAMIPGGGGKGLAEAMAELKQPKMTN